MLAQQTADALRAARGAQHCADSHDLSSPNANAARVIVFVLTPPPRRAKRLSRKALHVTSYRPTLLLSEGPMFGHLSSPIGERYVLSSYPPMIGRSDTHGRLESPGQTIQPEVTDWYDGEPLRLW